jgi:NAD(P)-dependent dehydrogenase (short-subunit alcohol dehydrogenase family)
MVVKLDLTLERDRLRPLLHLPLAEYRRQLEVNLIAPLLLTRAFAGLLGTDRDRQGPPGRIINITSVAGKIGVPFLGAYVKASRLNESVRLFLLH